jgi:hypothetical protein
LNDLALAELKLQRVASVHTRVEFNTIRQEPALGGRQGHAQCFEQVEPETPRQNEQRDARNNPTDMERFVARENRNETGTREAKKNEAKRKHSVKSKSAIERNAV